MKVPPRHSLRIFVALSALGLLVSSSIASCGVMFGAEEENFCAEQSCTQALDCPVTSCLCSDGSTHALSSCITEQSCCSKPKTVCDQACAPYGGWSGQADAGTGGTSGSGGRGGTSGASGTSGTAGTSGRGGTSGFGGTSGAGGSSSLPTVGEACSVSTRLVSCGCLSESDTVCRQVLQCLSSRWSQATACEVGESCLMYANRTSAGCGVPTLYIPYAVAGTQCVTGDTLACSFDLGNELFCSDGFWEIQEVCRGSCGAVAAGDPLCPSATSFCVGCR